MLTAAWAAIATALVTLTACIRATSPRAIARHLRSHPGAALAAAFGGAAIAIGCWALGLLAGQVLNPAAQTRPQLAITALLYAGVYLVMDTAHARRAAAARQARRAAAAPTRHRAPEARPGLFQPRSRTGDQP